MDRMNLAEVERLRKAANIASALEDILPDIDAMSKATMTTVFGKLSKGELTPDQALSYWYEMHSYHRLGQRLKNTASQAEIVTDRR